MAARKPAPAGRMRAAELVDRLQRHYIKPGEPLPGGTFLTEVVLGRRRADALYVGFVSSRGRYLVGHEIKVSRADWLHELAEPEKAEAWASQCHAWYVVAPSTDIVRPEELPPGWGLLVVDPRTKTRLQTVRVATDHPNRQPSWEAVHAIIQKQDTNRASLVAQARTAAEQAARGDILKLQQQLVHLRDEGDPEVAARLRAALVDLAAAFRLEVHSDYGHVRVITPEGYPITTEQIHRAVTLAIEAEGDLARLFNHRTRSLTYARDTLDRAREALTEAQDAIDRFRA